MPINARNSPLFWQGKAKWDAFVETYTGPYDFSESVYAGMNQKVWFVCPKHGHVSSDAKNLLNGRQCLSCAIEARAGKKRLTQKKVIARFVSVHGDRYDYSQVIYSGQNNPVKIICRDHGVFEQQPEFHFGGSGCPECFTRDRRGASQRDTLESVQAKVDAVFPNGFTLFGPYLGSQVRLVALCHTHNEAVYAKPNGMINGLNPCGRCSYQRSRAEDAIAAFLSQFTAVEQRNRTLIAPKEVDIYLPEHALAIEFCGMYWHSHGDREDEKKNKLRHAEKHRLCAEKGVRLITLYETEWAERPATVKRMLRNAIGKSRGRLMARKCDLRKPTTQEARAFYETYHPQGGAGGGEHYGLYYKDKLVACMRFSYGGNDRGAGAKARQWTLSRYATRLPVAGAASRLFKVFLAEHKPPTVKSFSDNRWFSGAMYGQLGFELEEEVVPDYQVWSQKLGLRPKPHYQRRALPKRLQEHGVQDNFDPDTDPRTEAEMTYLMGARRIYDCGKKRWVWTA